MKNEPALTEYAVESPGSTEVVIGMSGEVSVSIVSEALVAPSEVTPDGRIESSVELPTGGEHPGLEREINREPADETPDETHPDLLTYMEGGGIVPDLDDTPMQLIPTQTKTALPGSASTETLHGNVASAHRIETQLSQGVTRE